MGEIINILGSAGCMVSLITTHLNSFSAKAATDNTKKKMGVAVPINFYLQIRPRLIVC